MIRSLYISYNAITEPIVQSQVIPYLRELSKKGIQFSLLTYEKESINRKKLPNLAGIKWYRLKYHKRPTVPATIYDIITGCIYSLYIILKNRIKVVHARAIVAALAGFPAARLLGKKFIFDTRGIDSEEYVDAGSWKREGMKHKTVSSLEAFLTTHSDHVVVLTAKFLEIMKKKYGGNKINFSVIPCTVDTDKFNLKNKHDGITDKSKIEDKFVIVYIGSLGTWYMFEEMIDFFKVAAGIIKDAHFLLLTQMDQTYAKKILRQKGINDTQVTISYAGYDEIPDYLAASDVGIFFIKPVFSKLSSSPVKFAEYLACGIPVIINSGIGDTDKLVREKRLGAVISKFNNEAYANAIKDLMNMLKEDEEALRVRCRAVAEKELSLKIAVDRYDKVYKELTI